jgi:manganese/zinc/iron transport system permease protein
MTSGLLLGAWIWSPSNTAILIVVILISISCALVGSLLVLRRMSLMGDAISHAVLPGLVLAYLLSNSLSSGYMLLGAFLVGLLTTWLIQFLQQKTLIPTDSSMGIVFTGLFALGVILLKVTTAGQVDLDVECVLQGSLNNIGMDRIIVAGWELPAKAPFLLLVVGINALVMICFWKELTISSFDAEYAEVLGFRPQWLHYLVMSLTAATTVAAFEAVGSILVIALLVIPAAAAQLLTDKLSRLVLIAVLIAIVGSSLGVVIGKLGWLRNGEPAALVAVTLAMIFVVICLIAPRYGIISQWWQRTKQMLTIQGQDLLAMLYRMRELAPEKRLGTNEIVQSLGGSWIARWALWQQRQSGYLTTGELGWELTIAGEKAAARLVRSHRLWETWLVKHLGLPLDHVHAPAERMEHFIDEQLEQELHAELGAEKDPHGREIPR